MRLGDSTQSRTSSESGKHIQGHFKDEPHSIKYYAEELSSPTMARKNRYETKYRD